MDQMYWWIGFIIFWAIVVGISGFIVLAIAALAKRIYKRTWLFYYFDYKKAEKVILDLSAKVYGRAMAAVVDSEKNKKTRYCKRFMKAVEWRLENDPKVKEDYDLYFEEKRIGGGMTFYN